MLTVCQPLPLIAKPRPFDGAEWLFELKYDGFRALAYLEHGRCRLVSRNGHAFSCFDSLSASLAQIPHEGGVILDGEITCVDAKGRPRFNDLLFRRREPCFFAFDLLYLNGNNCRRDFACATEARPEAITKFRQALGSSLRGPPRNGRNSAL